MAKINNVVRNLEKDAVQLGTAVIEPNDNSFDLKVTPKV
jgi:hypothetical protein